MNLKTLRKITLSEGLSKTYDIHRIIFGSKEDILLKNHNELYREFEVDKWGKLKNEIIQKSIYQIIVIMITITTMIIMMRIHQNQRMLILLLEIKMHQMKKKILIQKL